MQQASKGRRHGRRMRALGGAAGLAAALAGGALAQDVAPAFNEAQAERGEALYVQNCALCHGADMAGGPFGPPVAGPSFQARWGGAPLSDLAAYVRNSMPPAEPGALAAADYAAILARQMQRNGAESGADALPENPQMLAAMAVPGEATATGDPARRSFAAMSTRHPIPEWPAPPDPFADFEPLTEAVLSDPPPEDWPAWRRSHRGLGHSPLDQIDRENIGELRLAWSLALPAGPNMNEPLVRDGVLFVHAYGDEVYALDAATGRQLWRYARHMPEDASLSSKKTLALYGEHLFVATSDLHMVALDARTGRMVWDRAIPDAAGFNITGGPLAADGVVMQGVGGRGPGGAFIAGFDTETGEHLWSFNTVAQPGEPGGHSWNGLPVEDRTGGSVWTSGTYDAESGLALFGPAPTYDTGPMRFPVEGEGNDGLYTDSTVALDPKTGRLAWHFQHMKNDQWDMDWAFERVIADVALEDGEARRVILTSGKEGLFDALDADTGAYLTTVDMGMQNFVTAIDPDTGDKTIDPDKLPGGRDDAFMLCPYSGGGRNWMPTAFDADSATLFVAAEDLCGDVIPVDEGGFLSTGVNMEITPSPGSDGRYGLIQALDMRSGETLWRSRQRAPQTTGLLATDGGLLFAGAVDRQFTAYDQQTGETLWSAGLTDIPNGSPISYAVDGKQYVAVVVGYGNAVTAVFSSVVPEIAIPPVRSSAIYVFALPE